MDKVHIVIAGRRNTGKSSLINCIIGQEKAVVSDIAGTTTDPVKKNKRELIRRLDDYDRRFGH